MREAHNATRVKAEPSLPSSEVKLGDIVCVYQPKSVLPKLNFQWSAPNHIVTAVRPNVCTVRSLVRKGGVSVSGIKKAGGLHSRQVNRKMLSSFPVPDSFFLGAKVCRKFGKKWFVGTVDETSADEGESVWRITYSDFDSEEVDRQGLAAILAYHPLLETDEDLPVPEVGTYVWFSVEQSPRLGKVVEIDPSSVRPITVHLYSPV